MNKESSIKQLKRIKQDMTHADDVNALDFAIRYMKNKTLEKIKTEIEELTITEGGDDYVRKMAELFSLKMKVLQIIDKYREG